LTTTTTLSADSIAVILEGQAPSGAYIASPTFSQYGFGWLRDGAYVALAMDAAGEHESASRFHHWVARTLRAHGLQLATILATVRAGASIDPREMLPTRYTLDGRVEEGGHDDWPNFQLDGYGTCLFALERHLSVAGNDADAEQEDLLASARLAADYIAATWSLPCFDYWEEYGDRLHTSTLAALAAGLASAGRLLDDESLLGTAELVRATIMTRCVVDGAFVKGPHDHRVDASLLSISTPFDVVPPRDPIMVRTVERIRDELCSPTGGVRRYVGDTYYGGSPWPLLTAWLGWHGARAGDHELAARCRDWVEVRAHGPQQWLAEQDVTEPQAPERVAEWEERWGPVADPLLWSHAKYLLLVHGDRS
jgi:GH15 family glucan-1,4-alpha-glucosidase